MKIILIFLLYFLTITLAEVFFPIINTIIFSKEFSSNVIQLDNTSFQKLILDNPSSTQVYLIMFYSPGCGHCKRLVPAWNELADELNAKNIKNLTLYSADVSAQRNIARVQKIQAYPTIRLFYKNRQYEYVGSRSAQDLKEFGFYKFLQELLKILFFKREKNYQALGPEPRTFPAIVKKLEYYWDIYLDFVENHLVLYLSITGVIIIGSILGIVYILYLDRKNAMKDKQTKQQEGKELKEEKELKKEKELKEEKELEEKNLSEKKNQ